jgi:DNA (cytosine-5)-methyltransferase 1
LALYNEIEPFAAEWLENLVRAGHIPAGRVERRSIVELTPEECEPTSHFFAGIAVWAHALRLAGWPDDVPVWTGSCPCQPFSQAGGRQGISDKRHLWPAWFDLIRECRPPVVLGEQVASSDGLAWLDAVQADLEAAGYAFAAFDLGAAGFGAPHIRQRLYFAAVRVADNDRARCAFLGEARLHADGQSGDDVARRGASGGLADGEGVGRGEGRLDRAHGRPSVESDGHRNALGLADGHDARSRGSRAGGTRRDGECNPRGDAHTDDDPATTQHRNALGLADDSSGGRAEGRDSPTATGGDGTRSSDDRTRGGLGDSGDDGDREHGRELRGDEGQHGKRIPNGFHPPELAGATRGFWADADWIYCRPEPGADQGKWRPVEPGTFPLAVGATARVGRLRAYGNAIVAPQAATFIRCVMDYLGMS